MLTKDADFTGGPTITDFDAYSQFIVGSTISLIRRNLRALEHANKHKDGKYQEEVNALYAAIDRIKRVE